MRYAKQIKAIYSLAFIAVIALAPLVSRAEIIDRVVAYVDDRAITQLELDMVHQRALSSGLRPTKADTLEKLINRILLVNEALKLRMKGDSEEELVHEYIDLKVRAFITLRDTDVKQYYIENRWKYKGVPYESLKDDIRKLLEEKKVNINLRRLLEKLHDEADIRIMLEEEK